RATLWGSRRPRRQAAGRSVPLSPPTAVAFSSRRRSPFLVLQDFGEPTPCPCRLFGDLQQLGDATPRPSARPLWPPTRKRLRARSAGLRSETEVGERILAVEVRDEPRNL